MNGPGGVALFGLNKTDWQSRTPPLTRENEDALAIWKFCGGWNPALIELAVAWRPVDDVDLLIAQLQLLRDTINKHEDGKRSAHGTK